MKPYSKTIWIILFSIAMGYLETSVVVYLRALYYPEGFDFPLKAMSQNIAVTELYREAATILMILAVSVLAAELWLHRFAWFLVIFSVWDITYYVCLKLLLGWPASLLTTDILFLMPVIWIGPVIAPVINSLTMILLALVILGNFKGWKPVTRLSTIVWILLITGSFIVLIAYMKDFAVFVIEYKRSFPSARLRLDKLMFTLSAQYMPRSFSWFLFCAGVCMHLAAIVQIATGNRKGP
jgi:hypothetical protein